jgi:phosphate transport system substrate-binding protein
MHANEGKRKEHVGMRMKRTVLAAAGTLAIAAVASAAVTVPGAEAKSSRTAAETVSGAGATFPAPLIAVWQQQYKGGTVNYNPIGSGGGIAAITNRTVDFGASDAPLTPDQFTACNGCVQIPWVLSATAVLYNLPGVKNNLHINGKALADIYLGRITKWDDARIQKLNKGVSLPDKDITVVYRSDGSGTTFNFTDYLSEVSPDFRNRVGTSTSVNWPTGVGGRGSTGLAGIVTRTEGAIGYADVAYALKNKIQFMAVQNKSGKYALPGLRGIKAASLSDKKFSSTNALSIVNPPRGKKYLVAYPICTYSYVILPLKSSRADALKQFVNWAITDGQQYGPKLLFHPLPSYVVVRDKAQLKRVAG